MGKRGDSVIGIDLGKHAFKGVALRQKSDSRFVLTNFASREVPETFPTAQALAEELKPLLRELGNGAKNCAPETWNSKTWHNLTHKKQHQSVHDENEKAQR